MKLIKTLLASLLAFTFISCAGFQLGDSYKDFYTTQPEAATAYSIPPLGESILLKANNGIWYYYTNVAEVKHPDLPNYLIFMDGSFDDNMDGMPNFVIFFMFNPEDMTQYSIRMIAVETAMEWLMHMEKEEGLPLDEQMNTRKLNVPKDWKEQLEHKNRMESNNTATF